MTEGDGLMKRATLVLAALALLLNGVGRAKADFIGVAGGSGSPGPMLGPYTMTSFALNNEPYDGGTNLVGSLPSPLGGSLLFNENVAAYPASSFPAYWSNGYTADVYHYSNFPVPVDLVLTLPANTVAFYLYILPNSYGYPEPITVTAQDGTYVTQTVTSGTNSPAYFGFYTTGGDVLTTLTISGADYSEGNIFLGEFGIASGPASFPTPVPSSLVLLGSGITCMAGYGWRRRKQATA